MEHIEVLRNLQPWVQENLYLLMPPEKAWQPSDFLPDLVRADWRETLDAFRHAARNISDEALVVLVGDMVTEEALPNYTVSLNSIAQDYVGTSPMAWAQWMRGWTAEENRHGDLLNAYLRLTGRVDLHSVEVTVHHLIAQGFNPKTDRDTYNGLVYTSFQERATRVSHSNVAKIARTQGDSNLAAICQRIAGDEARHESFYTGAFNEVMAIDPAGGILAFQEMLRGIIAMPGRLMFDGKDSGLFEHFARVAQRLGVYTVYDYAQIIAHLVQTWQIATRKVSGPAARAQEYVCRQADRYAVHAEKIADFQRHEPPVKFSWIFDRKI